MAPRAKREQIAASGVNGAPPPVVPLWELGKGEVVELRAGDAETGYRVSRVLVKPAADALRGNEAGQKMSQRWIADLESDTQRKAGWLASAEKYELTDTIVEELLDFEEADRQRVASEKFRARGAEPSKEDFDDTEVFERKMAQWREGEAIRLKQQQEEMARLAVQRRAALLKMPRAELAQLVVKNRIGEQAGLVFLAEREVETLFWACRNPDKPDELYFPSRQHVRDLPMDIRRLLRHAYQRVDKLGVEAAPFV